MSSSETKEKEEIFDTNETTIVVFAIIGMIAVAFLCLKIYCFIMTMVFHYGLSRVFEADLQKKYGGWAVVTGSTDGIGKCYAQELAKRGFNIVLLSRTLNKLEAVASEISDTYNVVTEIIQVDFSHGRKIYEPIAKVLENKDIGILVNNVGVLAVPRKFEDLTEDEIWNEVIVNVASVPAMTKIVVPGMLARKRGLIINVSSMSAVTHVPYFQVYAATKAFVRSFSNAIQYEYKGTGIDVQTVLPGCVSTNLTAWSEKLHKPGIGIPLPTKFARDAVRTIGYAKETAGYWNHEIQIKMINTLPRCMTMQFVEQVVSP